MMRRSGSGASRAADADAKVPLLDVNVLIALAWPNHVHHPAAAAWFAAIPSRRYATTPVTQAGFVRVSSHARLTPEAQTPQAAHATLCAITALPGHVFWADDKTLAASAQIAWDRIGSAARVTDAHLLAIALCHRGCLATFDRAIVNLIPAGAPRDAVLLLS
jgi:uncharacterized protein